MIPRRVLGISLALAMTCVVCQVAFVLTMPSIASAVPVTVFTFLPLAIFTGAILVGRQVTKQHNRVEALK